MWTALAIFAAAVLYLIDKNQKWADAYRLAKWCLWLGLIVVGYQVFSNYVPDMLTRLITVGLGIVVIAGIKAYEKWWQQ